jgi:hypothetical protein
MENDAELSTFIADQLRTTAGRRQLRAFLRDTVDVMVDQHAVQGHRGRPEIRWRAGRGIRTMKILG